MVKVPKLKPIDFRRSVTKDKISTPIAISTKHPPSILPPKKVIKALYDYEATTSQELSFSKGDFFHVMEETNPDWYEACNPATNMRGIVPVSYFQVLEKSGRHSGHEKVDPNAFYDHSPGGVQKPQPLYGIVLYDFVAERPDELNAQKGEPIIVIAQSNHEWFVAKPIGRLGGPGLIPVAFVEIRDHATGKAVENIQELMDNSRVPNVEEWKKMTQDYQESSISLGRFDFTTDSKVDPKLAPVAIDPKLAPIGGIEHDPKLAPMGVFEYDSKLAPVSLPYTESPSMNYGPYTESSAMSYTYNPAVRRNSDGSDTLPVNQMDNEVSADELVAASVESFHFEDERYWFLVRVELASGRYRILYRLYEDFYEFQIALLNEFPEEAGRTGQQRILPFMPGPLAYVNDMITAQRRADLDVYVKALLNLPTYILQHPRLQQLFGVRDGDTESSYDPRNDTRPTGTNARPEMKFLDTSPIDPTPPTTAYLNKNNKNNIGSLQSSVEKQLSLNNGGSQLTPGQPFKPTHPQQDSSHFGGSSSPNNAEKPTFIKIKIFYQDDLIAIRVPADVSYAALREKLYERLGSHVTNLRYKDEKTGEVRELKSDTELQSAIANTPKLMIYAE